MNGTVTNLASRREPAATPETLRAEIADLDETIEGLRRELELMLATMRPITEAIEQHREARIEALRRLRAMEGG